MTFRSLLPQSYHKWCRRIKKWWRNTAVNFESFICLTKFNLKGADGNLIPRLINNSVHSDAQNYGCYKSRSDRSKTHRLPFASTYSKLFYNSNSWQFLSVCETKCRISEKLLSRSPPLHHGSQRFFVCVGCCVVKRTACLFYFLGKFGLNLFIYRQWKQF